MLEDYWMHSFFDDPKAAEETFEDDAFKENDVAERLARREQSSGDALDDFETISK